MDGVPGRLNQSPVFIKREGRFHGECSELCGANYNFMPIVVQAIPLLQNAQHALHSRVGIHHQHRVKQL